MQITVKPKSFSTHGRRSRNTKQTAMRIKRQILSAKIKLALTIESSDGSSPSPIFSSLFGPVIFSYLREVLLGATSIFML